MFYDGDLQGGITLALQRGLPVVCFVRDSSAASKEWEDDWLAAKEVAEALSAQSVPLRLEAGSQEASFLGAFCPLDSTPTIVIVKRGQLIDRLSNNVNKDDFSTRLLAALRSDSTTLEDQNTHSTEITSEAHSSAQDTSMETVVSQDEAPISPHSAPQPEGDADASQVQALLQERRQKLEAEKKRRDEAEKAERVAKQRAHREEQAKMESGTGSPKSGKMSYQQEQVKKKKEAKEERARILRIIENDKLERKEREERRKALARAEADAEREAQQTEAEAEGAQVLSTSAGSTCSIQVRLLNGTTIRASFTGKSTIATTVRKWIDEDRTDGSTPYVLKQVMLPKPSRTLSEEEESESLHSLGLTPSATLILIPTNGIVSSYEGGTGRAGIIARTVDVIYGLIIAMIGSITGFVQYFLGISTATTHPSPPSRVSVQVPLDQEPPVLIDDTKSDETSSIAGTGPKIRIRTLRSHADEQEKRLPELYNGNQLNFEPRAKDKDEEKNP